MQAIDKDGKVISTSVDGVQWTEHTGGEVAAFAVVGDGEPGDPIKRIVGGDYKTVCEFRRAFPGWECDSEGWVVERSDGERFVVVTDHGGHRLGDVSTLLRDIERYEELVAGARKAIGVLKRL